VGVAGSSLKRTCPLGRHIAKKLMEQGGGNRKGGEGKGGAGLNGGEGKKSHSPTRKGEPKKPPKKKKKNTNQMDRVNGRQNKPKCTNKKSSPEENDTCTGIFTSFSGVTAPKKKTTSREVKKYETKRKKGLLVIVPRGKPRKIKE